MSTTLTNGLKLPDKGSVDWYADMQNNYQILDGAVGTVAEHSTQIAGKAPLVHTHTKSDITDFPAYGTTAGTICEGNDSRLSDARTPVAHTHGNITNDGKLTNGNRAVITGSDKAITESSVTDTELSYVAGVTSAIQTQLNTKAADTDVVHKTGNETIAGNKTWTGVNNITNTDFNFSQNFIFGDGSSHLSRLQFYDSVATRWGVFAYRHNTDNSTEAQMGLFSLKSDNTTTNQYITFILANDGNAEFRPFYADKKISLGTSSRMWKSVYSDSYYYGTTAWGLDKANTWTGINLFTDNININKSRLSGIRLYNNDVDVTANSGQPDMTVSDSQSFISFKTKYQQNSAILDFTVLPTSAYTKLRFATRYHTNSSSFNSVVIDSTVDFSNNKSFAPASNNDVDLGTSTNKWKTLNGINPGALSLPNKDKRIAIDTTGWTYTGSYANRILINNATQTISGWLYIRIENTTVSDYVTIRMNSVSIDNQTFIQPGSSATPVISVLFPVAAGIPVYVYATKAPAQIYLYECLGNV